MQLVGFFPTALAIVFVLLMFDIGAPRHQLTLANINHSIHDLGIGGGALTIVAASALSITLAPLQYRLVQWLEGYWSLERRGVFRTYKLVRLIYRAGLWRQRRRYERAVRAIVLDARDDPTLALARSDAALETRRVRFPSEDRLLPTTLGNVLRSAEDRAGVRYSIDSVTIWPRLHALLPAEFAAGIEDEVTQLDVSVRLVVTWLIAGTVGAGLLIAHPAAAFDHWGWVIVVVAMFLMAQLSYRGAVESALSHGRDIEVAIDLYRSQVLDVARLPVPERLSDERRSFASLIELYQSYKPDDPQDLAYRSAS